MEVSSFHLLRVKSRIIRILHLPLRTRKKKKYEVAYVSWCDEEEQGNPYWKKGPWSNAFLVKERPVLHKCARSDTLCPFICSRNVLDLTRKGHKSLQQSKLCVSNPNSYISSAFWRKRLDKEDICSFLERVQSLLFVGRSVLVRG